MGKQKKDRQFKMSVTATQSDQLREMSEEYGMSPQAFIRKLIANAWGNHLELTQR